MKVNKLLKRSILSTTLLLTMATSFQANAIVAIATGATTVALYGLGVAVGSFPVGLMVAKEMDRTGNASDEKINNIMFTSIITTFIAGLVLSGEHGRDIEFQRIPGEDFERMDLTEEEFIAFNSKVGKLTTAVKVVTFELNNNSTVEDAEKLWAEQEEILGVDAINGARKVLQHNFDQINK